ncbi:MAG: peptidyl-prolyl cis-trans isomerase [Gemmatimonadetes bacterium]|nr:peptidyl-prolyl cis-trans isomerase [Gemmatimonadota bacterium]
MRTMFVVVAMAAGTLTACDGFGQAVTSHTDVLARAAGHELTVGQAATLVAPYRDVPAQRDVVDALANLWVDYTLLATAAAQDSLFRTVDLEPLLRPSMDQWIVWKLREKVIQVDTALTDDELRALYEEQGVGLQVRARHILLPLPADATPAVRDSITALAGQLRQRAAGGEDFAMLARAFSQDGSAQQGGDLGFFARGAMVPDFENAAFALQPGQVSDVVQSPFGLHIIKVEERKQTPFEEAKDSFRATARTEREGSAEEAFIKSLTDTMSIEVQEAATANARELARTAGTELRGRAANRAFVRYKGGAVTAAEFLAVARTWPVQMRGQFDAASDEQIGQVLEGLAHNEILVNEARRNGLEVTEVEADSLREQMRFNLRIAAVNAGLTSVQPQEGETSNQAIARKVNAFIEALLKGEQQAYPLGQVSFVLRTQFKGEVFERAFDPVIARIEAQRPPEPLPTPPPPTTTGEGR